MVMEKTGNFLATLVQDKMRRETPQARMAERQLADYDVDRNFLLERRQRQTRQEDLQHENDLMNWAVESLNFIGPEEYPEFRKTAITFGLNETLLPESFESPEAFEDFRVKVNVGVPEYMKMKQGKPVTMSRVTDDGMVSTLEARTPQEIQAYMADGYSMGKLTGTPAKPKFQHATIYGPEGATKSVSWEQGTDYVPPEGWTLSKPGTGTRATTPTAQQAFKRISDIRKAKATLEKSSEITQLIATINPEFADMVGQQMPEDLKQELFDAWDNEINYLDQFTEDVLPKGLTEDMINQYMQKYEGKSREDIINAWKNRK